MLSQASAVLAYQDPLDVPAVKSDFAQQSLLLDVTRVGQALVAVGERGHILRSVNQGASWTQAEVPAQMHLNALHFVDDRHGWAVGEDSVVLVTEDGGATWRKQFDDRRAEVQGPLLDVLFINQREGFAVGVYGKLLVTSDGGENWHWQNERLDNLDEWHLQGIAAASNERLYIAGEAGTAYRSQDGGHTWQSLDTGHGGSLFGIAARRSGEQDLLAVFGVGGNLLVSRDSGDTWQPLATGTQVGLAGAFWQDSGELLIVGSDGVILRSNPALTQIEHYVREDRIPLSAIAVTDEYWVLTGMAGVARMAAAEFVAQ